MTIRLGYWGSGPISNFHIPALRAANLEPVIAYSRPNSQRLKDFASKWELEVTNSEVDFLKNCRGLDALVIALETTVTPAAIESALNLHLPILVEKPGSASSFELEEATKDQDRNLLFFGYNRRFYEPVQYAKMFLADKESVLIQATFPDSIKGFWQFRINGCHIIDILYFLSGKIRVEGVWGSLSPERDGFMAQLTSERNHNINLQCNWGSADNVMLKISSGGECLVFRGFEELLHYKGMEIIQPSPQTPLRTYRPTEFRRVKTSLSEGKPGFLSQAMQFRSFVVDGKMPRDGSSYEDAIHVLRVIDEIEARFSR